MKRLLILAIGSSLVLSAGAVAGKREEAARRAAAGWLIIVDGGRYGESWNEAAELFRRTVTRAQWEESLKKARAPLGKMFSRKLRSATFLRSVPNGPPGEYVVVEYDTDFEHHAGAVERVTPMKDPDGTWRVAGYFIQ